MPDYHQAILEQVELILHSQLPAPEKLNGALRHLAKYRSALIQQVLIREEHHSTGALERPAKRGLGVR
jgi:hypothetical protein